MLQIVVPELRDQQRLVFDLVNHPVLVGDAARLEPRQRMLERLGLADPLEGLALHLLDQLVDALDHLAVLFLPVAVILPGGIGKDQPCPARPGSLPATA